VCVCCEDVVLGATVTVKSLNESGSIYIGSLVKKHLGMRMSSFNSRY